MPIIEVKVKLPATIKKTDGWYVACCPLLDVFTQGKTKAKAKKNLVEAIHLFLESCYERGTLDDVLKESGFSAVEEKPAAPDKKHEYINVPLHLLSNKTGPQYCHA